MEDYNLNGLNIGDDWRYPQYSNLPTPPQSYEGSEVPDDKSGLADDYEGSEAPVEKSSLADDDTRVSVSTTFLATAQHRPYPPDVALVSKDSVFFYVHSDLLLRASGNHFLLPEIPLDGDDPPVVYVSEPSPVLNVILHAIYGISSAHYSPTFGTLVNALDSMPMYGINPKFTILPSTPLFTLLLSHAPLFPLELYALAAHYDIYDLAVSTSAHLLSYVLSRLTDQVVERMGPTYLKRLLFLHLGRTEALKRVLLPPPPPHPATPFCDLQSQTEVSRVWVLAAALLAWDVRPDMSTTTLELALRPLVYDLPCYLCKDALNARIDTLVAQWSLIKRTI
ncbi:hypothetical protein B0H14DRAFT_2913877 [Mycena olivaceomarginata]|nr:hypothetical protein B0H14DRAFT_2913877 [Mycena olivaceomarginata]